MREPESILGNSPALAQTLEHLSHLAGIQRPILVMGERGTGKELAAERLHFLSPRWDAPLIKVNCAAMAETLLESELFGHEPGAFTGATRTHHGRFERADGGTLFLDELGTMSLRLQEKLLRLVEYGEFERVGGQRTLQVDVRIVAATNADLRQMVDDGEFRADLLDRLSFDVVHIPALRERREDIEELATHFAVQMCAELGWDYFAGFEETAMQALRDHHWPGNIRELKNTVERSLYRWYEPQAPVGEIVLDPFASPYQDKPPELPQPQTEAPQAPAVDAETFQEQVRALELQLLQQALSQCDHNQRRSAQMLGLSYDQMRGLVRKHKLNTRKKGQSPP